MNPAGALVFFAVLFIVAPVAVGIVLEWRDARRRRRLQRVIARRLRERFVIRGGA